MYYYSFILSISAELTPEMLSNALTVRYSSFGFAYVSVTFFLVSNIHSCIFQNHQDKSAKRKGTHIYDIYSNLMAYFNFSGLIDK